MGIDNYFISALIMGGAKEMKKHKKYLSGNVYEYLPEKKACLVEVIGDELKIGDEVYLFDWEKVYDAKIERIWINDKPTNSAKKGDDVIIDFGKEVKEGTDIYLKK